MAPLLRRSWRPRGNPLILKQRTNSHRKVSAIAALCVPPTRDRVHLYFRLHPDANINADRVVHFLQQLSYQLSGPVVLLWDRLQAHRARHTSAWISRSQRFHVELLPPYAPELNPVENVWSYLKTNPMVNLPLYEVSTLTARTRSCGRSVQRRHNLLRAFLQHSPLSLRLK